MTEITLRKNQAYLDQTLEVMVDERGDDWCGGNSREFKRVRFVCDKNLIGKLVNVEIKRALEWILIGRLVK